MNYNRLIQVLRWNVSAYKIDLLNLFYRALAVFGIITFVNNIGGWTAQMVDADQMRQAGNISVVAIFLLFIYSAAAVCFNMKTKTEFISYAMLPATKAEKFVANIIYQSVTVLAITFAGLIAIDVIQALISLLVAHDANSLTWAVLSTCVDKSCSFSAGVLLILVAHASYICGGTFFRKHQFIYTTLAWFAFNTVTSLVSLGLLSIFAYTVFKEGYDVQMEWLLNDTWNTILSVGALAAIAALFYWLAYRFFCRIQVINNRFFN